jgi:hypothetical protein
MGRDRFFLPDLLCQLVLLLWRFHEDLGHNVLFVWWKPSESSCKKLVLPFLGHFGIYNIIIFHS